jgi:NADPH-dependent glutamate synthase beta subunit-like oxidoreductase
MTTAKLGILQSILVGATRCLDCVDPRCLETCPEHVDVRAAMRLIVDRTGPRRVAWAEREDEAVSSVRQAIAESYGN